MMPGTTRAIFLSYRWEETCHIVGRLADRLTERLGATQVFMDVEMTEPGIDFAAAIARVVASCDVLIALIGPTWLRIAGQWGRCRLDDPDDPVVLGIQAALERKVRVIPVLVDGAGMPDQNDLPEGLQDLVLRNTLRLDHGTFHSDVVLLLDAVEWILSTPAQNTDEPTFSELTRAADLVFEIDQVLNSDLEKVQQLEIEAYGDDAYSYVVLRQFLDISGELFKVCRDVSGNVIAYGIVSVSQADGWLLSLVVSLIHRRKGIGTALVKQLLNKVDSYPIQRIFLTVATDNDAAISLYKKLGFIILKVEPHYYGRNEDRIIMCRS